NRVDFIYEDDARRILLTLFEQIADARRADADEHFDKVRTADREERYVGFSRDCSRQQCLTCTRGTDKQDAFRNASTQLLELLRFLQEVDDLLQLFLGFIYSGNIFESDFLLMRRQETRAALAEGEGFVATALHLPHEEDPEPDKEEEGRPRNQGGQPRTVI